MPRPRHPKNNSAAWKYGRQIWTLAGLSCVVAVTALADPGDRALERLSSQLSADSGLVVTRYLISELPMYRLDEAGQPVFDATLLSAVVRNAAGQDAWGDGTWLIVTKDKTGLLVRQTSVGQARIAAMMRKLYEQRGTVSPTDMGLRRQLLRRAETDQEVRQRLMAWQKQHGMHEGPPPNGLAAKDMEEYERLSAAVKRVDEDNRQWMKTIVAKVGWPTATMVGEDGAHAAWLIVQHSDAEPKFQRECLDRMLTLPKAEYSAADAAYLTDRVLLAEGQQQRYGTQFTTIDGKLQPRPIADEGQVDERRADVGLSPLAEYAKELRATIE